MAKLTTKARKAIPSQEFALPGRRYPIEDRAHAANAKARVDAAVARKYPGMGNHCGQRPAKGRG